MKSIPAVRKQDGIAGLSRSDVFHLSAQRNAGDAKQTGMTVAVRDAYDARAKEYANLFLNHLDRVPHDRDWLESFARLVSPGAGVIADLGCGPGNVVNYLAELGVKAIGYDISPSMIDDAPPMSFFQRPS